MVTRQDPYAGFMPVSSLMDELLNRSFVRPASLMNGTAPAEALPYDLFDTGEELCLRAVVAGADPNSFEITFNQGTLLLKGYRNFYSGEQERRYTWYARNLREGEFQFAFALPVAINAANAEAAYENGVITIHLPKAEEARVRRITVNAPATQQTLPRQQR
jgi:HSP20 family protein